jgi:toxin ParE1/3/4
MAAVYRSAAARNDLIEHYVYLAENAGETIADRFFDEAEASFSELAEQPEIGAALSWRNPILAGIRKGRVRDFESVLIFYKPHPQGVTIVRVLHASRDWWRILRLED